MTEESKTKPAIAKGGVIEPDLDFIKMIKSAGGDTLKKCMQCANCSVACPLSPDSKPFPRKEMIWAQWGLKDKLIGDPDIWLCHQCNDCSLYCPRGAKPGDVLAALRQYSIKLYAYPAGLFKVVSDKAQLPILFGIPVALFLFILIATGHFHIPEGEVVFSKFLPMLYVDMIFVPLAMLMAFFAAKGVMSFWKSLELRDEGVGSSRLKLPAFEFIRLYIFP
ncbi:MAG: 4Fe-4S dicluster domain-containing protein, partial [Pseudomonadota bacterium]